MTEEPAATTATSEAIESIEWDASFALLNNRFMLWDMVRVFFAAFVFLQLLLLAISLLIGEDPVILPANVWLILTGIMIVLFTIATLIMGNRYDAHFAVDGSGVHYAAAQRERKRNRVLIGLSIFFGSPQALGASLIATSREAESYEWPGIRRAVVHEDQRVITLFNSWRSVIRLYCPPEDFDRIRAAVDAGLRKGARVHAAEEARAAAHPVPKRPWWRLALWVVVTVAVTVVSTIWTGFEFEWTPRLGILAGLLLLVAGLFEGVPRRIGALGAMLATIWFLLATAELALEPFNSLFGGRKFTWEIDTPSLAISVAAGVVLLGMAAWRLFGPNPRANDAASQEIRTDGTVTPGS